MAANRRNNGKNPILTAILTVIAVILVLMRLFDAEDPEQAAASAQPTPTTTPIAQAVQPTDEADRGMTLTVLEVGKADCLVLQCDGESMIIDGGNNDDEAYILAQLDAMGIEWFKYAVNTHPHEDHLGSLDAVINAYPVGEAILSPKEHTTASYERLLTAIEEREVPVHIAQAGDTFQLGGATLTVLSPAENADYDGYNDWSVVLMAQYGDVRYLLMGDAEKPVESDLLDSGIDLRADVLKVGHHGSQTSSKKSFLSAVSPTYALITCDLTEEAGEPNEKVAGFLDDLGIETLRTDLSGVLTVYTDGQDVAVSTERQAP
ncbi:MAG: MBL fold metallo-hydrolase [Candidatus Spyradocola sp.]|nr:MBL fold metallo-hydrolase [Candidatus Spyradocola sp.]